MQRLLSRSLTAKVGIVLTAGVGLVEETETVFYAQDAAHGVVDALLRDLTFLDELLEQRAEVNIVGIHAHVDTGVDSQTDSVLLVFGHMLTRIEVADISPVGHNHAVPVEVFLQPLRQILVAGMHRHAVDGSRIDHHRQGAGLDGVLERLEVFLAQHQRRDVGRRTVLT